MSEECEHEFNEDGECLYCGEERSEEGCHHVWKYVQHHCIPDQAVQYAHCTGICSDVMRMNWEIPALPPCFSEGVAFCKGLTDE